MVLIKARDGYYMAFAIGGDLTAWRNADAALIVTELNALDWFISANITHTKPKTKNINPMTASHYPKRVQTGRKLGRLSTKHYLQTGIFTYAVLGACTTAGNGAEITTVLCLAKALCVAESTFHFWVSDGAEAQTEYYVWLNVAGTDSDPTETGTAIEADISGIDTAIEVAEVIDNLIAAKADVGAENSGTATVTITNAQNGAVKDCCSSEGLDTGFTISVTTQGTSTHTITKATDETPINIAFHYEKEGTTDSRRKDMLGPVPHYLDISVSEKAPIAKQTYNAGFALTVAGSDLAQPAAYTQKNLPLLTWYNYKNSSGASAFTYNSGAIDVDIVSIDMHIGWMEPLFGTYDGTGYPTNGLVRPPVDSYVTLGVRITDAAGTALNTISDLRAVASSEGAAEYAGDIDFIADFYRDATQFLKFTWADMYIDPDSYEEVFQEEGNWFDGVTFTLRFKDETSSVATLEKNSIDKTYYEND